ncbi:MAG: DUF3422 family protein [Nitrospiria bacterium]
MNFQLNSLFKAHINIPAHIHHVAYLMKDPPHDSPLAKEEFNQILSYFEVDQDHIIMEKRMGLGVKVYPNGDKLLLFWRLHTEYYSYQTWHISSDSSRQFSFGSIDLPGYLFQSCPLGTRITWMDILIQVPKVLGNENDLKNHFTGPEIYGSRVLNGEISLFTDFTPDENGRVRFLVQSLDPKYLSEKTFFIAESLSFLENYTQLILLPMDDFNQNMDQFYRLEKDQILKREEISLGLETSTPKQFKEWLILLTRTLSEVNRIGDNVRYNLASAVPYDSILQATLKEFNEDNQNHYPPLNYFVFRKVRGIADGYIRLIERIDALNKALEGTIAVLRTRVDLAMEEQNLTLLKSVDQTTKNQVHLQQTVEGLSVIVLTYYITGIAFYFFKGISEWGYIQSPYFATGIFLPFSFLIAFGLVYRVKRALKNHDQKKKE